MENKELICKFACMDGFICVRTRVRVWVTKNVWICVLLHWQHVNTTTYCVVFAGLVSSFSWNCWHIYESSSFPLYFSSSEISESGSRPGDLAVDQLPMQICLSPTRKTLPDCQKHQTPTHQRTLHCKTKLYEK